MISIKEKIYSKAFEDGVNYAIQKMFGEEEEKKPSKTPYVIGGTAASALGGSLGAGIGGIAGTLKELKKAAKEAGIENYLADEVERIVENNPKAAMKIAGKTILGGALGLGTAIGGTMALYNRAKKKMNKKDQE
jgi:hypothetical protein